ncbi:WD40-repeat-containing domain protein [Hypoxylon sp. NC1633]|nr:WD40-repeat-containing domain protein [Hypoxylon sp. NC1633]
MDEQGCSIVPLQSLTLDLPPSCVEFCPGHPDYFVVGTYNLQKDIDEAAARDDREEQQTRKRAQARNGSLVLFKLTDAAEIEHVQTVLYPSAILDLHFHPRRERGTMLAVVSSTGTVSFFKLSTSGEPSVSLTEINTHKPLGGEEDILFLSCSWHPHVHSLLAITTSSHQVHILQVDDGLGVRKTHTAPVTTHTLEAWTVAFSPFTLRHVLGTTDSSRQDSWMFSLFSGGDDSKLLGTSCVYDRDRNGTGDDSIETPNPAINLKGHKAGVTAILPLELQLLSGASVVVTGCYDDHIRVFSIHDQEEGGSIHTPKLLAEQNLHGGVWRLKLVKLEKMVGIAKEDLSWAALILASCMHAGSRVLEIRGDYAGRCETKVLGRFETHKSMNYGSDFQPGTKQGGLNLRCVSTSFYDKLLCLWEY